ncbi:hypothetical protein EXN66_Car012408 [Channa argus]|uniref:Uncharacterized protein n=1 Tax=Channa argus TaxID=215402 RepID=A0A6G1Q292_CHAAH|nr:hypothetical protein EXN66_Car012408 [Channa argus]
MWKKVQNRFIFKEFYKNNNIPHSFAPKHITVMSVRVSSAGGGVTQISRVFSPKTL